MVERRGVVASCLLALAAIACSPAAPDEERAAHG
jgi:hypothetical protein